MREKFPRVPQSNVEFDAAVKALFRYLNFPFMRSPFGRYSAPDL